jgi:hypothetical protein
VTVRLGVVLAVMLAVAGLTATVSSPAPASTQKAAFRATLTADGHTPRIIVKWWYTVRVTDLKGKPMAARITVRIKDPLGGVHPVQFGRDVKKDVRNYPIVGRFRDWVNWPRDSAIGITLTFQVVVKTTRGQVTLSYPVRPHA